MRAGAISAAALDVQVLAREREEQLQVAQYETRVAQEDMQAARDQLAASKQELQVRCDKQPSPAAITNHTAPQVAILQQLLLGPRLLEQQRTAGTYVLG